MLAATASGLQKLAAFNPIFPMLLQVPQIEVIGIVRAGLLRGWMPLRHPSKQHEATEITAVRKSAHLLRMQPTAVVLMIKCK